MGELKSVTSVIMMLNKRAVKKISKKQKSVASSSTNVKYIAISERAKLAIWGSKHVSQIKGRAEKQIPLLLGDKKAYIQIQGELSNTLKIKHIDVEYHHIVDEIRKGVGNCDSSVKE